MEVSSNGYVYSLLQKRLADRILLSVGLGIINEKHKIMGSFQKKNHLMQLSEGRSK